MLKKSILILCAVFLFSVNLFAQQSFTAKVVGVVDGDTLTVITKDKRQMMFRLAEIDAPEKEQDFGANARQFLLDLVSNQTVTVSGFKKDCLDRFTASVAFNNKDLSLTVVKSGNAWVDSTCQTNEAMIKEESLAKENKMGLWQDPNPVRPGDFLKQKQVKEQVQVNQTPERHIFAGLAPTPPPIMTPAGKPSGLYIGMPLKDFVKICGEGEKSKTFKTEYSQSFGMDIPATKNNADKGCGGSFNFRRTPEDPDFMLSSVLQ